MNMLRKWFINPAAKATELIAGFFNTAPDLMSDETARKLRNKEEARKLIEEIRSKRSKSPGYSAN